MRLHTLAAAIIATTSLLSGQAIAYQEGDFILRVGAALVDPDNVKSDDITVNGISIPVEVDDIDDDTQLGLTFTYMVTDNVGLGLLASSPFEHDITSEGDKLGSTKLLPPTLTAQYFPLGGSESRFQPYIGAGVNYTVFFDEKPSSDYVNTLGDANLEIDDSWGWAFQAGADFSLTDNLVLNAAVWKIQIEADAEFKGALTVKADSVEINPWVYMVGVGYKF